jgi:S1-C subfamily serine protease
MTWEEDDPYFDADDGPFRPYLSPDDRLWRHPAEIGAAKAEASEQPSSMRRSILVGSSAFVVLALLTSGMLLGVRGNERQNNALGPVDEIGVGSGEWTAMADAALDGVVTVTATDDDGEVSVGAAFAYQQNGHKLMTSSALIAGAASITVTDRHGTTYPAVSIGEDRKSGVAVIDIGEAPPLRPIRPGLRAPDVGEAALLVSPDTAVGTAEATSVVAVDRCLDLVGGNNLKQGLLQLRSGFPATATGSPVLNSNAEVVGLAIEFPDEEGAYAVPMAYAATIAFDLTQGGVVQHSGLGIDVRQDDGEVVIQAVKEGGAAAAINLREGDVIVRLDGIPIDSACTLNVVARSVQVGDSTDLTFRRNGKETSTPVTMGLISPS